MRRNKIDRQVEVEMKGYTGVGRERVTEMETTVKTDREANRHEIRQETKHGKLKDTRPIARKVQLTVVVEAGIDWRKREREAKIGR